MKKIVFVLLAMLSFSASQAQEHVGIWRDKCERESSLDMTRIERRDPQSKELCRLITEVVLPASSPLYKEFFAALDQDLPAAELVEKRRVGGVERIVTCDFLPHKTTEFIRILIEYPDTDAIVVKIDHQYCFYGG